MKQEYGQESIFLLWQWEKLERRCPAIETTSDLQSNALKIHTYIHTLGT